MVAPVAESRSDFGKAENANPAELRLETQKLGKTSNRAKLCIERAFKCEDQENVESYQL